MKISNGVNDLILEIKKEQAALEAKMIPIKDAIEPLNQEYKTLHSRMFSLDEMLYALKKYDAEND
jgi:hypothetical protein